MEMGKGGGGVRKGLRRLRTGCFANLGLKLVAIVLALILDAYFRVHPIAEAPAPASAGPPSCMCPCPCTEDGRGGRLPAPSSGSSLSPP